MLSYRKQPLALAQQAQTAEPAEAKLLGLG